MASTAAGPETSASLTDATELIAPELEQIERLVLEEARSEVEVLQEAAHHILSSGGKRLRPQLLLMATLASGGDLQRGVPLAGAAELVHTATLVHDDIVDESDSRRGRVAVQFYFGNSASVMMGDFLVVRAFGLIGREPSREIWDLMVETIARMCEGEVLQICVKSDLNCGLDVYETIIDCKTAVLMAACTRIGGMLGGVSPAEQEALQAFGYNIGMAFQITDDILDFIGDEETLGKPVGGDLREGKVTLPVIYALEDAAPEARQELVALYERTGPLSTADISRSTEIIREAGGFERSRQYALAYIEEGRRQLRLTRPHPAREALFALADQIVDRRR